MQPRSILAANTVNAQVHQNVPARLKGWHITNRAAYEIFVRFYDKSSAAPLTSDTPVLRLAIPAATVSFVELEEPLQFANGLSFRMTKAIADNDATVLAANDAVVNLFVVY